MADLNTLADSLELEITHSKTATHVRCFFLCVLVELSVLS